MGNASSAEALMVDAVEGRREREGRGRREGTGEERKMHEGEERERSRGEAIADTPRPTGSSPSLCRGCQAQMAGRQTIRHTPDLIDMHIYPTTITLSHVHDDGTSDFRTGLHKTTLYGEACMARKRHTLCHVQFVHHLHVTLIFGSIVSSPSHAPSLEPSTSPSPSLHLHFRVPHRTLLRSIHALHFKRRLDGAAVVLRST